MIAAPLFKIVSHHGSEGNVLHRCMQRRYMCDGPCTHNCDRVNVQLWRYVLPTVGYSFLNYCSKDSKRLQLFTLKLQIFKKVVSDHPR